MDQHFEIELRFFLSYLTPFVLFSVIIYADDEADRKKKKKTKVTGEETRLVSKMQSKFSFDNAEQVKQITNSLQLDGNNPLKEDAITDHREVDHLFTLSCHLPCLNIYFTIYMKI